MDINLIIVAVYSYFLGSIPFGLVLTKIFLKKDIREIGSGNIGTTNVLRTGKKSLAVATLVLDLLKGYFSIVITFIYFENHYFDSSKVLLGSNKSTGHHNIRICSSSDHQLNLGSLLALSWVQFVFLSAFFL